MKQKLNKNGKIALAALVVAIVVDWLRNWRWAKQIVVFFTSSEKDSHDAS